MKDSAESLYCSSEQCGPADTGKCCANKETCDQYTCSYNDGLVNVQNDESIYCEYDHCTDDPDVVSTCCENRASCVGFRCDTTMFLDKTDKDTQRCPEATCSSEAWVTCCDLKAVCLDPGLDAYICSPDAEYTLSPIAENLYCNGTICESPRDDAFCCINTPSPTIAPTPEPVPSRSFIKWWRRTTDAGTWNRCILFKSTTVILKRENWFFVGINLNNVS